MKNIARSPQESASGRERVTAAALSQFSQRGFSRVTTDSIAREAGVSQAYVVRAFGGKNELIRTVCLLVAARVEELFRHAEVSHGAFNADFRERFLHLAFESDEFRLLAQLFACGSDPDLGPLAREGFTRVTHLVHGRLGGSMAQTRQVMAVGMLAVTLSALDFTRPADPQIEFLMTGLDQRP